METRQSSLPTKARVDVVEILFVHRQLHISITMKYLQIGRMFICSYLTIFRTSLIFNFQFFCSLTILSPIPTLFQCLHPFGTLLFTSPPKKFLQQNFVGFIDHSLVRQFSVLRARCRSCMHTLLYSAPYCQRKELPACVASKHWLLIRKLLRYVDKNKQIKCFQSFPLQFYKLQFCI